jgi:beta-glucosidase-like glycosyl hydrolase
MAKVWIGLVLSALLLTAGCRGGKSAPAHEPAPRPVEISDLTDEARHWADSVCATLTLRQKVAQLFMPAIYASDDIWTLRQIRQYADSCIGGVVLLKGDSGSAAAIADTIQSRGKVHSFIAIDAEWGLAMRLADAPEFPANNAISDKADEQLLYDYGRELARECRLIGINMVLGPVVDVSVPNSFMRRRSFGENPQRVADLALAYARGLEDGDVVSVAKHFPGHGSVSSDSHKRKGVIERSLNEMDSVDLYPFRRWVEQRLTGIMVGHLAVPSIDSEMRPAAVSRTVITDLLRDDLGFSGLILTDALNMKGAEGYGSTDAIWAGADIVVAPDDTFREVADVVKAVEEGVISREEIDRRVRKILFYKFLSGAGSRSDLSDPSDLPDTRSDIHLRLNTWRADSISERLKK